MKVINSKHVALCSCGNYTADVLDNALDSVLQGFVSSTAIRGNKVLLKPNLISSRGPSLACTNAHFLAAAVRWFNDHGADVVIGDSPAFGTTSSVLARHKMIDKLSGLSYTLVHFNTPVSRTLSNGLQVEVAAEALDCDLFVNLPKIKAHNQMFMTCAVKNIFGIVVGMRKAMLHMRHGSSHDEFSEILLDLPSLLPPLISLVDGVEVMHRSGPVDGKSLHLGCVAGSRCPVSLDTAILNMLELPPEHSPLYLAAARRKHPGSIAEGIKYPLELPQKYHGSGFVAPLSLNPVRFNPLRLLVSGMRRLRLAVWS